MMYVHEFGFRIGLPTDPTAVQPCRYYGCVKLYRQALQLHIFSHIPQLYCTDRSYTTIPDRTCNCTNRPNSYHMFRQILQLYRQALQLYRQVLYMAS